MIQFDLFKTKKKKYRTSKKQITRVVVMHALADCIETYATDFKLNDLVALCSEIRVQGNRYGNDFVEISDYMKLEIDNLNYNIRQLLPELCHALYLEAVKIQIEFIKENPLKEYTQIEIAKKIRDYFNGEFISKTMLNDIKKLIIDIRENNFYE